MVGPLPMRGGAEDGGRGQGPREVAAGAGRSEDQQYKEARGSSSRRPSRRTDACQDEEEESVMLATDERNPEED